MPLLEAFDCADLLEMAGIAHSASNGGFSSGNPFAVSPSKRAFSCGSRRCWIMLMACTPVVVRFGLVYHSRRFLAVREYALQDGLFFKAATVEHFRCDQLAHVDEGHAPSQVHPAPLDRER